VNVIQNVPNSPLYLARVTVINFSIPPRTKIILIDLRTDCSFGRCDIQSISSKTLNLWRYWYLGIVMLNWREANWLNFIYPEEPKTRSYIRKRYIYMFCITPEKIHEEHQMLNFPRPSKCFPNFQWVHSIMPERNILRHRNGVSQNSGSWARARMKGKKSLNQHFESNE